MSDSQFPAGDGGQSAAKPVVATNPVVPIINLEAALARLCGDVSLLRDLAKLFLADAPVLLQEARTALNNKDLAVLERVAHSLKGLASNFDGHHLILAAKELEELARHKKLTEAAAVHARLEQEHDRLTALLVDLAQSDTLSK